MALFGNVLSQPSVAKVSESEGNGSSEDDKGRMKHRFSEPWEDSDLILVVEHEKFHVHRLIYNEHELTSVQDHVQIAVQRSNR